MLGKWFSDFFLTILQEASEEELDEEQLAYAYMDENRLLYTLPFQENADAEPSQNGEPYMSFVSFTEDEMVIRTTWPDGHEVSLDFR